MTNNNNVKNFNNTEVKDQNADIQPLLKAKENCPEGGYDIPAQVAEWMSDDSFEVMQHFGLEAADLLNKYSNALEDALINQVQRRRALEAELEAYRSAERGDVSL